MLNDVHKYWPVAFQAVFVLALAVFSSHPIPFEFSRPLNAAFAFWIAGGAFLISRSGVFALRSDRPLSALRSSLLSEGPTVVRALKVAVATGSAIALLGWAKSMIPHVTSYWADPYLADADKWIFGEDPWRLFRRAALNQTYVAVYLMWFGAVFGMLGVLAFSRKDHSPLILGFLLIVAFVGTLGQFVLPSAGPMFYQRLGFGDRFAELVATNQPSFNAIGNYLWGHYLSGAADLGTGISAMPSMHVALAIWLIPAGAAVWRPLIIPTAIYAALIWAASIASGWHYALDGVVSLFLVVAIQGAVSFRYSQRFLEFTQSRHGVEAVA